MTVCPCFVPRGRVWCWQTSPTILLQAHSTLCTSVHAQTKFVEFQFGDARCAPVTQLYIRKKAYNNVRGDIIQVCQVWLNRDRTANNAGKATGLVPGG